MAIQAVQSWLSERQQVVPIPKGLVSQFIGRGGAHLAEFRNRHSLVSVNVLAGDDDSTKKVFILGEGSASAAHIMTDWIRQRSLHVALDHVSDSSEQTKIAGHAQATAGGSDSGRSRSRTRSSGGIVCDGSAVAGTSLHQNDASSRERRQRQTKRTWSRGRWHQHHDAEQFGSGPCKYPFLQRHASRHARHARSKNEEGSRADTRKHFQSTRSDARESRQAHRCTRTRERSSNEDGRQFRSTPRHRSRSLRDEQRSRSIRRRERVQSQTCARLPSHLGSTHREPLPLWQRQRAPELQPLPNRENVQRFQIEIDMADL